MKKYKEKCDLKIEEKKTYPEDGIFRSTNDVSEDGIGRSGWRRRDVVRIHLILIVNVNKVSRKSVEPAIAGGRRRRRSGSFENNRWAHAVSIKLCIPWFCSASLK